MLGPFYAFNREKRVAGTEFGNLELCAVGKNEQYIAGVRGVYTLEDIVAGLSESAYSCGIPCLATVGRYFPFVVVGIDAHLGSHACENTVGAICSVFTVLAVLAVGTVYAVGAHTVAVHNQPLSVNGPVVVAVSVGFHGNERAAHTVGAVGADGDVCSCAV